MQKIIKFVILPSILLAIACSSAEKRAAELMENGSYEEAEASYENILRDDPQNTEAQAGLQKSRLKVLDTRLINIRKSRLSGSTTELALLDILTIENKWRVEPMAAASFTQREELDYATAALLHNLSDKKFTRLPLLREFELRRVEPLFQVSHATEFKSLRAQTQRDGQALCKEYSKQVKPDLIYIAHFTRRFCNFWKANAQFVTDESYLDRDLFREVTSDLNVSGFAEDSQSELLSSLNEGFKSSPWYSPTAEGKLNLPVHGNWFKDSHRATTQLLHTYNEEESYVENVSVLKTRQVPYTVINHTYDPLSQTDIPVTATQYRDETYWTTEPQTRFRTVQKTYPYGGWSIEQTLKVQFEGSGSILGHSILVAVNDQSQTQDTESDASYPAIGLQPKKATLIPDPHFWLQNHEQQLSAQLNEKTSALWFDLYCKNISVKSYGASGNQVYRCLRLQTAMNEPPPAAAEWHQRFIGLTAQQTNSMLK